MNRRRSSRTTITILTSKKEERRGKTILWRSNCSIILSTHFSWNTISIQRWIPLETLLRCFVRGRWTRSLRWHWTETETEIETELYFSNNSNSFSSNSTHKLNYFHEQKKEEVLRIRTKRRSMWGGWELGDWIELWWIGTESWKETQSCVLFVELGVVVVDDDDGG